METFYNIQNLIYQKIWRKIQVKEKSQIHEVKINFPDLTFCFEQEEGAVFLEPIFLPDDEIIIWMQSQNLYCQFRIVEGDYAACSYSLMNARHMLDQHGLEICCSDRKNSSYDDKDEKKS